MSPALVECLRCFYEVLHYLLEVNSGPQTGTGVLGFSHFGSPTQGCPCSSLLWYIPNSEGAELIRKCSVTTGNLVKTQYVCEEKFLEGATPATNPSAGLMRQLECRLHQRGRTAAEPSPVIIFLWPLCAPLIAIPHLPLCLS